VRPIETDSVLPPMWMPEIMGTTERIRVLQHETTLIFIKSFGPY